MKAIGILQGARSGGEVRKYGERPKKEATHATKAVRTEVPYPVKSP